MLFLVENTNPHFTSPLRPWKCPHSTMSSLDTDQKKKLYLCLVSKKICERKCGFLGEKGHLGSQHVLQLRKLLKELMEMASLLLLQVFFLIWVFLRFLFPSVFRLVWLLRKWIERKFNFNFNFLCYFVWSFISLVGLLFIWQFLISFQFLIGVMNKTVCVDC